MQKTLFTHKLFLHTHAKMISEVADAEVFAFYLF